MPLDVTAAPPPPSSSVRVRQRGYSGLGHASAGNSYPRAIHLQQQVNAFPIASLQQRKAPPGVHPVAHRLVLVVPQVVRVSIGRLAMVDTSIQAIPALRSPSRMLTTDLLGPCQQQ